MIAWIEAKQAGLFNSKNITNNILSGFVVGIVAIPLAMAFAIASGAKPEMGLYTAIVSGVAVAVFGGCRLQIAGPTGAFIVILAAITAKFGISGLMVSTLMAGVILVLLGVMRLGAVLKFIPRPVIVGFTSGIAVIIWVGQWKDFFGLPAPHGELFHEKFLALVSSFGQLSPYTTMLGLLSLFVLLASPKVFKRIPSPLVAMVLVTALQAAFHFEGVATIGTAFGGIPSTLPMPSLPSTSMHQVVQLIGPAFTIAFLGAIESLLSAVVADGMAGTRHNSNQELIGQGIANILCPFFGGFAATGAIARTATNIKNGATSPLSGIVHSAVVLLTVVALAPLASNIPLCALAAILFVVSYNMCEARHFIDLVRTGPKADIFILLMTFGLTVFTDLVVAVNVGVGMASLIFMGRMANSVHVEEDDAATRIIYGVDESKAQANGYVHTPEQIAAFDTCCETDVMVYTISGPFFFGAAERIESIITSINVPFTTVVLRFGNVPFVDATGVNVFRNIIKSLEKNGKRVVLCNMQPYVFDKFNKGGILDLVGRENIIANVRDLWTICPSCKSPPAAA
ncbi:MAG: sodium-independent anion transporter [Deltaproteobacteria bacterium HGW-Deltaproteobacteria-8]|jgi:SulP family sulfate permease|nr:MAG: sodium-independent anion transporter [Deltaproteobacteria bacterium HGW-Deltaproteobacteria-8]